MKSPLFHLYTILIIVMFASCSGTKKSSDSKSEKLKSTQLKEEVIKHIKIESDYKLPETLDYTIKSVTLLDNIFTIEVTYKGGCGDHNFELVFNRMFAKSLPVQATLYLEHTSTNETCSEEITRKFRFFGDNVRHPQNKTVICKVNSYDGRLTYNY